MLSRRLRLVAHAATVANSTSCYYRLRIAARDDARPLQMALVIAVVLIGSITAPSGGRAQTSALQYDLPTERGARTMLTRQGQRCISGSYFTRLDGGTGRFSHLARLRNGCASRIRVKVCYASGTNCDSADVYPGQSATALLATGQSSQGFSAMIVDEFVP